MRVVLDTGFISGLIRPQGSIGAVLRALRDGKYRVLYSNETLIELIDVLGRDIFHTKYHITPDDISTLIQLIRLRGEAVVVSRHIAGCRDPKEYKFLEAALSAKADCIVTGDQDLLILHPFQGIPILQPAEFLTRL
jgi:uncharacterized protein